MGRLPGAANLGVNRAPLEKNWMRIWLFQNLLSITPGVVSSPCRKGTNMLRRGGRKIQNHLYLLLEGLYDLLTQTYLLLLSSESPKSRETSRKCAMWWEDWRSLCYQLPHNAEHLCAECSVDSVEKAWPSWLGLPAVKWLIPQRLIESRAEGCITGLAQAQWQAFPFSPATWTCFAQS